MEDESLRIKGAEVEAPEPEAGSKDTPAGDNDTDIKEEDNRTREVKDSANSSAPSHESNNLDFDLSSDSDSDSITEKPPSSESDCDGKSLQVKKSGDERVTQEPNNGGGPREEESKGRTEGDNSSDAAEPSGVLLPGPELGNGCSDRREPETESQNSEQSGVTMGEELLDQSMEDEEEEDEEGDVDQDDHLIYLEEVLERIHGEYYARYEAYLKKEAPDTPDIRRIVPQLKSKTLEGTMIVFSGMYPTNYPMDRTREYYHAKALGAKIGKNLVLSSKDPCWTTHLIAARAGM